MPTVRKPAAAATVIGAFVFGAPSLLAVVVNYLRRSAVRGTVPVMATMMALMNRRIVRIEV